LRTSFHRHLLFGVLGSTLLGACTPDRGGPGAAADVPYEERYGGTVVIGSYGDLQSMNSLTASDYHSNNIQRYMLFMPLVRYDENVQPQPWLAERWDTVRVHADTIELTFQIRRDIRWHDGQPTTAEDVLFTYERATNPSTGFPNMSNFDMYSRNAELVDPYTFRVRLRPHAEFLDIWAQTSIMPRHLLGDVAPEQLIQHPFGTSAPVGNGPFRFVRRVPGQEWVFEANPDFPEALGGRPYLDRIVYRYIPEMTTLLTELLTGRVDVYFGPNPNQADQIRNSAGVRLDASPNRQWVYMAFNTRRPQFQDARVRRAIAMGINREQIVDALLYGLGDVGRGTVTPAHWSFAGDDPQTQLPYDTAQARQLLAEAGWTPGADGILRNAQGQQFQFTLITNAGNDTRRDILEIVQAQLEPLGIVVTPRLVEWNTMIATLQDPRRNFDAVVSSWVTYVRQDDADILHSRNVDRPYQYVGFANPRADQLIDTVAVMMDRDAARPLWLEYQRLMVEEAPYVPLYYPKRLTGIRNRVQGVEMDIRGELPTVTQWWIAPRERAPGTTVRSGADTAAPAGAPAN
jgi:peptide/nickel transport system substrate-binding protein